MDNFTGMVPFRLALLVLWAVVACAQQQYCSNQNTGADYAAVNNIYQSNGACLEQCNGQNYAFAIVQWQNCWCSNYIPSNQESTGSCSQKCPGYPDDLCGNTEAGLYGYLKANAAPSGTAGASSSQSSSTAQQSSYSQQRSFGPPSSTPQASTSYSQPSPSYVSTTVYQTQTVTPIQSSAASASVSVSLSYVTLSPTSSSTPPPPPPTTSSIIAAAAPYTPPSSTTTRQSATPTPVTSVETVLISGAIVTQTVTSTPTAISLAPDTDDDHPQRKQVSGGAIAGAVIGGLAGLALILIGAFLLWRRKQNQKDTDAEGSDGRRKDFKRNASVLSKTGLLGRGRPVSMAERDDEAPYNNTGNNSVRQSMLFGAGGAGDGISPVSPLGSQHGERRFSRPLVYDQRLNPSALFANADANSSRVSIQDHADYSRPLGIMNPDPRSSFDSRVSR